MKEERKFKVGDKVWDIRYGDGTVERIDHESNDHESNFKIIVKFCNRRISYIKHGYHNEMDAYPSLYHQAEKPLFQREIEERLGMKHGTLEIKK